VKSNDWSGRSIAVIRNLTFFRDIFELYTRFRNTEPEFELYATKADLSVLQPGRLITPVTDRTLQKDHPGLSYGEGNSVFPPWVISLQ
jgi:hypothetical protein